MMCLAREEAIERLSHMSGWSLHETRAAISKQFQFRDFVQALAFMTEVAGRAEELNHHPEWTNIYSKVDVTLTTHDVGGLSNKDFQLAGFMDQIDQRVRCED